MLCRREAVRVLLGITAFGRARTEPNGPFCWDGKGSTGRESYVRCSDLGLSTGAEVSSWVDIDLSGVRGLRLVVEGRSQELPLSEIFNALEQPACPEPHAKP